MISLIAVMAANRVIGKNNQMPWHHKADLRHFKSITMGKPIVMGRKTYESIGRALPGRTNIVVSRQADWHEVDEGVIVVNDLNKALLDANQYGDEVMVMGGAQLYEACLPLADKIYLTIIDHDYEGDTYFPAIDRAHWREMERRDFPSDADHVYSYSFVTLLRKV